MGGEMGEVDGVRILSFYTYKHYVSVLFHRIKMKYQTSRCMETAMAKVSRTSKKSLFSLYLLSCRKMNDENNDEYMKWMWAIVWWFEAEIFMMKTMIEVNFSEICKTVGKILWGPLILDYGYGDAFSNFSQIS